MRSPLLLPPIAQARRWTVLRRRRRPADWMPWAVAVALAVSNVTLYALTVQQEASNNQIQDAIVHQDQTNVRLRAELARSEALDHVEALASSSLNLVPAAGTLFLPAPPPAPDLVPRTAPLPSTAREAF
jgi:hypothetical protein